MIEAYTAADVRAAEQPLLEVERGFHGGLMDRAAAALATVVVRQLRERTGRVVGRRVVGLVGGGNNGADTLHALARLRSRGVDACALVLGPRVDDAGLAALRGAGGRVVGLLTSEVDVRLCVGDALALAADADVLLDGVLGIGARGAADGFLGDVDRMLTEMRRWGEPVPLVVAVDVPSGIGVDDGALPGPVLTADLTVTFGAVKPGLVLPPAATRAGRLEVVDLGLADVLDDHDASAAVGRLEAADVAGLWPVPAVAAHKYSRGVVGVVAGTATYPGAAVLTVAGAQGAGCGMVRYVGPGPVADAVVAAHPEVVAGHAVDVHVQAWVVGPGVADDDAQRDRAADVLRRHVRTGIPVVVDAGGLEVLPDRLRPTAVLTPHAGELARLLTARGHDVDRAAVEAEPLRHARLARELTGATVLLKGAVTVVVGAAGVRSQAEAPSWLATAGAGDVLAGVLGALLAGRSGALADGVVDAVDLAAAAAHVHGRAAAEARSGGPVTAGEVARAVPDAVAALLR